MQDPTSTPEYPPRPSGTGTGTIIAVVAAVVVVGVVSCGGVLLLPFRLVALPAGSPPSITPANATEQTVLELAAQQVPSDWTVATAINEGTAAGTYVVTYATRTGACSTVWPAVA